ncbi:bifunctional helix-turn-helix transcriptional regulator/GNAT family N-acetyltransferase [Allosphingosinicella sp.]|uniref:bifunctional helix-turn-helix transcriptional regulator/GNAT family N-acetyltransferase n=1 Tax=Allosphingosinicella sp. TaxID=2823234 RepID=UPI002FC227FF
MEDAVTALRAFNRFHTRFVGALDAHYMQTDLSLVEARLLYEIAHRDAPVASELQAELGLDAGYVSRLLRRFQAHGWISRGRGKDARRRPIASTSAGREAFDALDRRTRAEVEARIAPLGATDRATLVKALDMARALLGGGERPGWTLRTFRAGDMGMIAARQSILYAEGWGWGRPMEILQGEVTTAFLRDFKPGREQCWVAERAGMMAGSVLLVDGGDGIARLRLLYVEPWARGLGIGQALVAECIAFARAAGYARMQLWTHSVLLSARRIYAAAGMKIVKEETHEAFGKPEEGEIWEMKL